MSKDIDQILANFRQVQDDMIRHGDPGERSHTHLHMPMEMRFDFDFGTPGADLNRFVIQPRYGGGIDCRPMDRIITVIDAPRTNRKLKRARCKARRRARLPRRHWVARRRTS